MNVKVDYEITTSAPEFAADMYEELVEGFYKTAVRIRDRARELVPVSKIEHRHLRDTIRAGRSHRKSNVGQLMQFFTSEATYYKDDPAAFVIAGDRMNPDKAKAVYWPYWVEYGTYFSPARPFMRPAMIENFNPMLAETERAAKRAMNKRRRQRKWGKGHA